jgi:hypothetical protein
MMGVRVTKGSATQNSTSLDINTSNLSSLKMKGIFGRFLGIYWPPA